VNVRSAALRHGIQPEDIIQAASGATLDRRTRRRLACTPTPTRFDGQGRLLETVVLVLDSENELVTHAMKARPQMLELLP
jgi:hypothetical protein